MIYIIGDTHGKINQLIERINSLNTKYPIIINGDIGFKKEYDQLFKFIDENKLFNIFVNMGNHDFYPYKYKTIGNFMFWKDLNTFIIRGGYSIDKSARILNVSYFTNEELNFNESNKLLYRYEKVKPKIVISHDCPESIYPIVCNNYDKIYGTTPKLLQECLNIHTPDLWVFGHHHKFIIHNQFVCLNELQVLEVNTETLEYKICK